MALAIISLSLNSCKYHGRNENIPDKYSEEIIESLAADKEEKEEQEADSIKKAKEKENKEASESLSLREHRVYYVDYSWSMKKNSLMDTVKSNIKNTIPKLKGQNVRIEIIPFLDSVLWRTKEGKCTLEIKSHKDWNKLEDFINTINPKKRNKIFIKGEHSTEHYNTHHSIAVEDFINNRINDSNEYHIMILLTDGRDEFKSKTNECDGVKSAIDVMKNHWSEKTKGKYVYGVFVDLMGDLKNIPESKELIEECFEGNEDKGLRYIKGRELDFSAFLLKPKLNNHLDYKNDSIVEIPFGYNGRILKELMFENGSKSYSDGVYEYTIIEQPKPNSTCIRVSVQSLTQELPETHNARLRFKYNESKDTTQLIKKWTVDFTIVDKKTPNIDFKLPDHEDEDQSVSFETDLQYCKKFLGTIAPEWTDTMNLKFSYEKSQDAKHKNPKLKIKGLPKCVKILYHGETFDSCEITLDTDQGTDSLSFIVDTSLKDLDGDIICKDGSIEIVCGDLLHVYANDYPINNDNRSHKIASFRINVDEHCHPIEIIIWCLGALLLLLLLFALLWRLSRPRFLGGNRYIYFEHSQRGNEARYIFYVINGAGLMIDGIEDNSVMTCKLSHKLVNSIVVGPESERPKYHSKWILNGKNVFVNCNFINDFKNVRRIEIKPVFLDGTNFILKFIFGWKFIPYSRDEHIGIRVRIIMDDGVSTVYTAQVNMTEFNTGQSVRDSFRSENDNGNHNIDQWLLIGVLNMQLGNNI